MKILLPFIPHLASEYLEKMKIEDFSGGQILTKNFPQRRQSGCSSN